jgi:BspA type Leucine rich repeat region (6 copies)/Listeria-Bacteroides repeat domain (List_Bact_rpt)
MNFKTFGAGTKLSQRVARCVIALVIVDVSMLLLGCPPSNLLTDIQDKVTNAKTATYTVTYDGNSNSGGSVPVDGASYPQGQKVTVLGNTGGLTKSGCSFAGWNTKRDGSGTTYSQGQSMLMGSGNVVLYARWTTLPTYTVIYNSNGIAAGSAPVDSTNYTQGQMVTTLGNPGNLSISGFVFAGWTTNPNTTGLSASYTAGTTWAMGNSNVTLYAIWIPANLTFSSSVMAITLTGYGTAPTGALVIPPGVTSLGNLVFVNCTGLTSITIPSSVTSIGSQAFENCPGLTSITIPSSVTSVGSSVFDACSGLTSINIPASVTSLGSPPFGYCSSLYTISVDSSNPSYMVWFGVLYNKNETMLIEVPGAATSVTNIPSTVTSIGRMAFDGCAHLTSVTLPINLTSISDYAFWSSGVTTITIPAAVTAIGYSPFAFCTALTAITVDSSNLNYSSSSGVLFNKAQTTLIQAPGALSGSYVIPSTVTSIGDMAFVNCTNLTGITIPSSVTSIGFSSIQECTKLTSVTIPSSVTSMATFAFFGDTSLTGVYMQSSTPPSLPASSRAFDSEASSFKIHVPSAAAVTAYDAATGWLDYYSIITTP